MTRALIDPVDNHQLETGPDSMLDVDPVVAAQRLDGYVNPVTGVGTVSYDKTMAGNIYGADFVVRYLTGNQAQDRWRGSDLGARIVETIPNEMLREGWELKIQATQDEGGSSGGADEANAGDNGEDDAGLRLDARRRVRRGDLGTGDDAFGADDPKTPGADPAAKTSPFGGASPIPAKHEPGELNIGAQEEQQQVEAMNKRLEALGVSEALRLAACYARCYGGGAILLGIDDGKPITEPLDVTKVKKITHLTVLRGGWDGEIIAWNYYEDITKPKYGQVKTYQIRRIGVPIGMAAAPIQGAPPQPLPASSISGQGPTIYYIHESRLIVFPGKAVSNQARVQMRGWGDSIFTRVDQVLSEYNQTWSGVAILMQEWTTTVLSMPNLAAALSSETGSDKGKILNRALILNMTQSIARTRLIDDKEKLERMTVSMSGVDAVLAQFGLRLAAASDMPVDLLMGQTQAGGLNKGDTTLRFFYDRIAAEAGREVLPGLRRIVQLLFLCSDEGFGGKEPDQWSICMKPLYQLSAVEQTQLRNQQSQTDVAYIQAGVLTPEEVAASRFGGSEYSTNTVVDLEGRAKMAADREAQKKAMQEQFAQRKPDDAAPSDNADPAAGDPGNKGAPSSPDREQRSTTTTIHVNAPGAKTDGRQTKKKRRDPNPLHTILKEQVMERALAEQDHYGEEGDQSEEEEDVGAGEDQNENDWLDGFVQAAVEKRLDALLRRRKRDDFNPDEPRDESGKWTSGGAGGAGAASGSAKIAGAVSPGANAAPSKTGARLLEHAVKNGGFTFDAAHDTFTTKGFSVSAHPEHERVIADREITTDDLDKYMADKAEALKQPGAHFGAWHDTSTNRWVFDVSHVEQDRDKAIAVGRKYAQDGIYDLGKGETIPVTTDRANKGESREVADQGIGPFDRADDFDPAEARDASGKWTTGGIEVGASTITHAGDEITVTSPMGKKEYIRTSRTGISLRPDVVAHNAVETARMIVEGMGSEPDAAVRADMESLVNALHQVHVQYGGTEKNPIQEARDAARAAEEMTTKFRAEGPRVAVGKYLGQKDEAMEAALSANTEHDTSDYFTAHGLGAIHERQSYGWVNSSSSPEAMRLHTVLSEMGVPGTWNRDERSEKLTSKERDTLKEYTQRMYAITQEKMARTGVPETLTLYRGVKKQTAGKLPDGTFRIATRPASSWTDDIDVARSFARQNDGSVLKAEIPRTHVYSYHGLFGNGSGENEYVVLGAQDLPVTTVPPEGHNDGFDPDEARDADGKWTNGGAGADKPETTMQSRDGVPAGGGTKQHLIEHTKANVKDEKGREIGVRVTLTSSPDFGHVAELRQTRDGKNSNIVSRSYYETKDIDEAMQHARADAAAKVQQIRERAINKPAPTGDKRALTNISDEERAHAAEGWKKIASYKPDTTQVETKAEGPTRADLRIGNTSWARIATASGGGYNAKQAAQFNLDVASSFANKAINYAPGEGRERMAAIAQKAYEAHQALGGKAPNPLTSVATQEHFDKLGLGDVHRDQSRGWVMSASSRDALKLHVALQEAGVSGTLADADRNMHDEQSGSRQEDVRRYMREMYALNQEALRDNGKKTLTLYRGVMGQRTDGDARLATRPASSWTDKKSVATKFAESQMGRGRAPMVVKAKVPIERIYSHHALFGNGSGENEYVVAGAQDLKVTPI